MEIAKTTETRKEPSRNELVLKSGDLPFHLLYGDKKYVVILTKNDKLLLQKAVD